jgi:acyl dehydratase
MSSTAVASRVPYSDLPGLAGRPLGTSRWHLVTQDQVDRFASTTCDEQWLHVDPVRARSGPFGATVAHGFLTMSLSTRLLFDIVSVAGATVVNYGVNRLRFPAPLPVGSRVRLAASCDQVTEVAGGFQSVLGLVFEREGGDRPVCVADLLFRFYPEAAR